MQHNLQITGFCSIVLKLGGFKISPSIHSHYKAWKSKDSFKYNSDCVSKCLSNGKYNIKASLTQLENYAGIKALAFQNFFRWDEGFDKREDVINRLKAIAPNLPYYQCNNNICNRHRL